MTLPTRLVIYSATYALDGGTICLRAADGAGHEHTVVLVQHARPQSRSPDEVPGRLYFDRVLVPIRSEFETRVLSLLRSAQVCDSEPSHQPSEPVQLSPNALILGNDIREPLTRGAEDFTQTLVARVLAFVASDEYLRFAERVAQAADETRYDVWVVWDGDSLSRAVIKTKQLLGLDLRAAKELVEQGRPVVRGVTTVEVVEWARRYRESGLAVRVSPEFRWRLP